MRTFILEINWRFVEELSRMLERSKAGDIITSKKGKYEMLWNYNIYIFGKFSRHGGRTVLGQNSPIPF